MTWFDLLSQVHDNWDLVIDMYLSRDWKFCGRDYRLRAWVALRAYLEFVIGSVTGGMIGFVLLCTGR